MLPPCLYVASKVLSISEKARFEIASCAGFYTTKRPAQSIFVQNGEVFTRGSDINLYRFFSHHMTSQLSLHEFDARSVTNLPILESLFSILNN